MCTVKWFWLWLAVGVSQSRIAHTVAAEVWKRGGPTIVGADGVSGWTDISTHLEMEVRQRACG